MQADPLSSTFAALADPTRRAIIERLAAGEASVGELAAPFTMSLPAVSRHLNVLEQAGLIRREKAAQWRRCRLEPGGLAAAASWLKRHERFWNESLDRLEVLLREDAGAASTEDDNRAEDQGHGQRRRDDT